MNRTFDLVLFSTNPTFLRVAVTAGVSGIIVDWEHIGKEERQGLFDTQINRHSVDDLRRVRGCTDASLLCRINKYGQTSVDEIEQAIEAGADEILLPMVQTVGEVERVLDQVRGRCGVGILIETLAAVNLAGELARLPLSRVYVGLNDLAIERRTANIFAAVADGTVEQIRTCFRVPFGFGGLTLPDRGSPIPCRLLIAEMARLGCNFSFLRRSFFRDIWGHDPLVGIPRILEAVRQAHLRSPEAVARDRHDLEVAIRAWPDVVSAIPRSRAHGQPTG